MDKTIDFGEMISHRTLPSAPSARNSMLKEFPAEDEAERSSWRLKMSIYSMSIENECKGFILISFHKGKFRRQKSRDRSDSFGFLQCCALLCAMFKEGFVDRLLEILAVVLNLLFTVFYLNGNAWCYFFGINGPIMLIALCYRKKLYAEPVLQLFYIGFAVYGFYNQSESWIVRHSSFIYHLPYILGGICLSFAAGFFLKKYTDAKLPIADSVVTVFGIIGTWLLVNYIHESWLYFVVINALAVYIYVRRKLFIGAAMYLLYFVMALDGFFELKIFYS